jgi:serine/threonine protein kinase
VDELLEYIEDAAKGIDYLNQPGDKERKSGRPPIQHCDIKPQNILIVGNSAQVCDFGLARPVNDARKTSQAAISFAYVSPELIQEQTSPAVDQYSLAVSYYELRTGSLPFEGKSTYDVMFAHLQGKLTFARVTEGEQAVLKRATSKEPADRFPSCLEMVRALRRAVEGKASSGAGKQSSHSFLLIEKLEPGDVLVHGYRAARRWP